MRFAPSSYSGSDALSVNMAASGTPPAPLVAPTAPTTESESGWESYVPLVRDFFFGKGARTSAAITQAKIVDLEKKVASNPWPLKGIYETQLLKARAELAALQLQAEEEDSAAQAQQIARVAFAALGISLTVAGVAVGVAQLQKARLLSAQRRQIE